MQTKEKLYDAVKKEIYLLVFAILNNKKESENLSKKILVKLISQKDIASGSKDIHIWVARYTTLYIYRYLRQHRKIMFKKKYLWNYQKHYTQEQENKFNNAIQDCCSIFLGKEDNYRKKWLQSLTYIQIILIQFHWYEKYSVSQIAKMLKIDKDCIQYNLNIIKNKCIKYECKSEDGNKENQDCNMEDESITVIDMLFPQFKKNIKNVIDILIALVILVIAFTI